jgi:hypothetical protein
MTSDYRHSVSAAKLERAYSTTPKTCKLVATFNSELPLDVRDGHNAEVCKTIGGRVVSVDASLKSG